MQDAKKQAVAGALAAFMYVVSLAVLAVLAVLAALQDIHSLVVLVLLRLQPICASFAASTA